MIKQILKTIKMTFLNAGGASPPQTPPQLGFQHRLGRLKKMELKTQNHGFRAREAFQKRDLIERIAMAPEFLKIDEFQPPLRWKM